MKSLKLKEDWEFNVLGIYNFNKEGPFDIFYRFIKKNHKKIKGDIIESGVFNGKSLLATAYYLKQLKSKKLVYGFDSFGGFPKKKHPCDSLKNFKLLLDKKLISLNHYRQSQKNIFIQKFLRGINVNTQTISTSSNFANVDLNLLRKKIKLLGLKNIVLRKGLFEKTMSTKNILPRKIMAVFVDCDLYPSYKYTLEFVWERLSSGGLIFLDEFYSLKFPGARLAVLEFLKNKKASLKLAKKKRGDFERWYIIKK